MLLGGVDGGHVVAERAVHQGECDDQRGDLEHISKNGAHIWRSEPLREHKGEDEIAQQGDGHDQTDEVFRDHSFATPLATSATSANTAIVATTKATSAIVNSCKRFGLSDQTMKPRVGSTTLPGDTPFPAISDALTAS